MKKPLNVGMISLLLVVVAIISRCDGLNLAPFFTADMNQHTLLENTPVGTVIYTLKGEDPEGSKVIFGLKGTDKLSVDPSSGEVKVEKPIDRESRSDFNDNEIRLMVIIEVGIGHGCYTHFYHDKVTLSLLLTKAKFYATIPYHALCITETSYYIGLVRIPGPL